MSRILAVGLAVVDLVFDLEHHVAEDDEVRALDSRRQLGGNSANSLQVWRQLGHQGGLACCLGDDTDGAFVQSRLDELGVDRSACRIVAGAETPRSAILRSRASGSRTIVHHRALPEYRAEDFARIDLRRWDWLHFEGRAVDQLATMLRVAAEQAPDTPRSLEIEKPRAGIEALLPQVDLIVVSRQLARAQGHRDASSQLRALRELAGEATLVCAWGDRGAWAMDAGGELLHQPAWVPAEVVDSLAAGDVFNAALIDAALRGLPLDRQLQAACELAGRKVGRRGLDGLVQPAG